MKTRSITSVSTLGVAAAAVVSQLLVPSTSFAGTSQNSSVGNVSKQGSLDAITISLSGQVALRNWTASPAISALAPGASSTYYFGLTGATAVTYTATSVPETYVQLGKQSFSTIDQYSPVNPHPSFPADVQQHSALRIEWHEQGSVQGLYDLVNDQIGYTTGIGGTGIISNVAARGPSASNPTWVNSNQFTAGGTINGHTLAAGNYADTYDSAVYERASGKNLLGGQNRIQYSHGEYKTENFALSGTADKNRIPGQGGFGKGNPALLPASTPQGLGTAGGRQSFLPESVANQSTDKVDPESPASGGGANAVYSAGPWNTAGANNIDSQQFAVTAVTYSANPGTGLKRINKGDGQWLQATGRLSNGADFNVVSRANDAGQRTVPAVSVGLDPSWAVGENDNGNTSGTAASNAQRTLSSTFRFSGKTSGTDSRNAIAQSRLAIGALSISEARGAGASAPIRVLDVDFINTVDTGNLADFKEVNFDNIVSFDYAGVLISHINSVKKPNQTALNTFKNNPANASAINAFQASHPGLTFEEAAWAIIPSSLTGIKGDQFGNVKTFTDNILQSVGSGAVTTAASANNPADGLYASGYLIPGLLNYKREYDGAPLTPNSPNLSIQAAVKASYGNLFTAVGSAAASKEQTRGSNAFYGQLNPGGSPLIDVAIPITSKDDSGNTVSNTVAANAGNYLFGNFNQNGVRDYSSVKEGVNAALSLAEAELAAGTPGKSSIYAVSVDGGVANNTVIASNTGTPGWSQLNKANTKGDLITLGDYNSDGVFDGQDVYRLARGASLSDAAGGEQLTSASGTEFSERVRNANAKLNKNAALDYAQTSTAALGGNADNANAARAFLRQTARSVLVGQTGAALPAGATLISSTGSGPTLVNTYTFDPTGTNAFNKLDVNRDGKTDFYDAAIVDGFNGKSYKNLDHQLNAVVALNQNDGGTVFVGTANTTDPAADQTTLRRQISLVDAELNDDGNINSSDSAIANQALSGAGTDTWTTGVSHKVGPNTIVFNRSSSTVTVPSGASLRIADGTVENQGVNVFSNGNKLDIATGTTGKLKISGGSSTVGNVSGTGTTEVTGGTLTANHVRSSNLTISGGKATVTANGTNTGTSIVNTLSIAGGATPTGTLDLTDNNLIVRNGAANLATIVAQVKAGLYNGTNGYWDGPGIQSSAAAANGAQTTALGVIVNNDGAGNILYGPGGQLGTSFDGVSNLSVNDVLIKYTWWGDADLDGAVTSQDFDLWATGNTSGGSLTGWLYGDFDYDGTIGNTTDFDLWATGNSGQSGVLSGGFSGTAVLPEPASLSLLAMGAGSLLRRRRKA